MRSTTLRLSIIVWIAANLSACLPGNLLLDASLSDGGSFTPDTGTPAPVDAGVLPDSGPGTPDEPDEPDATIADDAGSSVPSEPDASEPDATVPSDDDGPGVADLVIEFADPEEAVSFRNTVITEDDCELYEGCVGGTGARSLIELSFSLTNVGNAPIDLGRPFEDPLFYPSFCQDSYVIDGFFAAELRDEAGQVVMHSKLSTSCIAGETGYTCRAQGLGVGDSSPQPIGRCDFLDVTGIPAGNYTLRVTANPDHVVSESDFDNNSAETSIYYAACAGTICGGTCCPSGVACDNGVCMLPDLRVSESSAAGSLFFSHQTFGADSCELEEMCVSGSGRRRLLEFEGRIENWGPGDLNPGPEANNPLFEFSECHEHYHFRDFTDYRLLNQDGSVAAQGHKQSFCLVSMVQVEGAATPGPIGVHPPPGETGCNLLQAGWADIYGVGTPCQWVDITDVPTGDYVLELAVNPLGRVLETDTTNNVVQIPVHIADDTPCTGESEICGDDIDQDCDDVPDAYDSDCQVCYPGDPYCQPTNPVTGNDTCDQAYEMVDQGSYDTSISADNTSDVTLACGGEGGDVFFGFTLDSEQIVYLGTIESNIDTVLGLYRSGCDGESLRCEDQACSTDGGQFVQRLAAGHYIAVVKAKHAGDSGSVQLKFQHADGAGVMLLDRAGVYEGDTSTADNTVDACTYYGGPGDEDGGVGPDASTGMGGSQGGGMGGSVGAGGSVGTGAGGGASGMSDGGMPVGPVPGMTGNDDIYAVAKCRSTMVVSTCGTADFASVLEVRDGSIDSSSSFYCSSFYNLCTSEPNGATAISYGAAGLAFIVVDGRNPEAAGPYQMSVIY